MDDPYGNFGSVYTGPGEFEEPYDTKANYLQGFRLPFSIISPWTRGGHVFVENADHISQLKFVEQWLSAKGYNVTTDQIPAWRSAHMSDLTKAFNFAAPDYSLPNIPDISPPLTNSLGSYTGYSQCEETYRTQRPTVPYGKQTVAASLFSEQGSKGVRGALTEGRYLVFEMNGYALANSGSVAAIGTSVATQQHEQKGQRWVVHQLQQSGAVFNVSSAVDETFIASDGSLTSDRNSAAGMTIQDLGNGQGYTVLGSSGYLQIGVNGSLSWSRTARGFSLFSVTYSS
jgi:phospholipase C